MSSPSLCFPSSVHSLPVSRHTTCAHSDNHPRAPSIHPPIPHRPQIKVGLLRLKSLLGDTYDWLSAPEMPIGARLRQEGFSEDMIDRFFRPFLGGIFFDRNLGTTDRLLIFVMRMLATGSNCLPATGIGAVSKQLAEGLPSGSVHTNAKAVAVSLSSKPPAAGAGPVALVTVAGSESIAARRAVLVATEGPEAERLFPAHLGGSASVSASGAVAADGVASKAGPPVGTLCLYFSAAAPPSDEAVLFLNGTDSGIVNNCCVPSNVAPSYAPVGKHLISVSIIGVPSQPDADVAEEAKRELESWFPGKGVSSWSFIRAYRIPYAQPPQAPPTQLQRPVKLGAGVYVCGDHRDTATLDGAMISGRRAAEAVIADLKLAPAAV